jgi:hypothetical protein
VTVSATREIGKPLASLHSLGSGRGGYRHLHHGIATLEHPHVRDIHIETRAERRDNDPAQSPGAIPGKIVTRWGF